MIPTLISRVQAIRDILFMCLVHVHVLENVRPQCLTLVMRGSRIFFRMGDQAGRPENSLDQLILQFTEGVQWFYNRENYTFEGSRGGPIGPPIPPLDPHLLVVSAIRWSFMKRGGCWTGFNFTQNDHRLGFVCVK